MIMKSEAIASARDFARRHKIGWSESDVIVDEAQFQGEMCFSVHTSNIDLSERSWMEQEFTTPVRFLVNAATGTCFGYEYGNRGVTLTRS